MNKKESLCEFEMDFNMFKTSFCWSSNLSNDFIISAYARSENGFGFYRPWVWKLTIFMSEIGSGFGEPGGTPPQRIPRDPPPPEAARKKKSEYF